MTKDEPLDDPLGGPAKEISTDGGPAAPENSPERSGERSRDRSLGDAVYFRESDYPGYLRRLAAMTIDFFIIILVSIGLWNLLTPFFWDAEYGMTGQLFWLYFSLSILFTWVYLAVLKRSTWKTLGYRLTGVRIVDLQGERPSLWTMTFRLSLWLFGPFHFFLDILWLSADAEHQTLRDCYAKTYVVKEGAKPIGRAPVVLAFYSAGGLSLMYRRVNRDKGRPL